jgi:hypothetical protein
MQQWDQQVGFIKFPAARHLTEKYRDIYDSVVVA